MTPDSPPGGFSRRTPPAPSRPAEDLSRDRLLTGLPRDADGRPLVGRIPLLSRLGRGGMGAVYYAIHPRLQIEVAVKILHHHLLEDDPGLAERFAGEARVAATLSLSASGADHIVRVFDVDQEGDTHFLVMEYVPGESAGAYLKRKKAEGRAGLDEREALAIVIAATRGLVVAHAAGIVHRDIKPDNILVPRGDFARAKLADLGLAKPEGSVQSFGSISHVAMGTPGFMAPEQIQDARSAGPPADVFSIGATLQALLAGQGPFVGSSVSEILRKTETQEPEPLSAGVSQPTCSLVARCLAKKAVDRFANAEAILSALTDALVALDRTPPIELAQPLEPSETIPMRAVDDGGESTYPMSGAKATKKGARTRAAREAVLRRLASIGEGVRRAWAGWGRIVGGLTIHVAANLASLLTDLPWMGAAAIGTVGSGLGGCLIARKRRWLGASAGAISGFCSSSLVWRYCTSNSSSAIDGDIAMCVVAGSVPGLGLFLLAYLSRRALALVKRARTRSAGRAASKELGDKAPEKGRDGKAAPRAVFRALVSLGRLARRVATGPGRVLGWLMHRFERRRASSRTTGETADARDERGGFRETARVLFLSTVVYGITILSFIAMLRQEGRESVVAAIHTPLGRLGMEFVEIRPSPLRMNDAPDYNYFMQTTEVTQKQWEYVMGTNPSWFKDDNRPVEMVSWDDCQNFLRNLNDMAASAAAKGEPKWRFALPTELEWEYACRAGSRGQWWFGNSTRQLATSAWYDANANGETHPVGLKRANGWGQYDMHGNVWEWCTDGTGDARYVRGGSWLESQWYSSRRGIRQKTDRTANCGFRLVLE